MRHNFLFTHMFAKRLFKTINEKQITVIIALKRRPHFSMINYLFNFRCTLKAKLILKVSKIYKGSRLFGFECAHVDIIEVFVLAKPFLAHSLSHKNPVSFPTLLFVQNIKAKMTIFMTQHSFLDYGSRSTLSELRKLFVLMSLANLSNQFSLSYNQGLREGGSGGRYIVPGPGPRGARTQGTRQYEL